MGSEVRRGTVRIATNYIRLLATVLLGIAQVPILIRGTGLDGFGLWGLIGATIGFADLFRELVRASMNRELGAAYHAEDPARFPAAYNAAVVVALMISVPAVLVYGVLYAVVPWLNISPEWVGAARLVVLNQALYSFVTIITAPQINMFLVSERYGLYNLWLVIDRAGYFLAAAAVVYLFPRGSQQANLVAFSLSGAVGIALLLLVAAGVMMALEPRCRPRPSLVTRGEIRAILGTTGWNAVVGLALNLHIRCDQLIMNIAFGQRANAIFSVGVRLTGYVRMLAVGMTDGLDVVGARLGERADGPRLARIMRISTRMHALVVLPASVFVWFMAEPLIRLWIGKHLEPDELVKTVGVVRLLVIGFAARGISDCWLRMLYGAGHIRRYAPLILAGGIANPVLATLLVLVLAPPADFYAAGFVYAGVFVLIHLFSVPFIAARCVEVTAGELLVPLVRPALVTAVAAVVLPVGVRVLGSGTLLRVAAIGAAFSAVFGVGALAVGVTAEERRFLLNALLRRRRVQRAPSESSTSTAE